MQKHACSTWSFLNCLEVTVEGSVFTADTTRREDSVITAKKAFIKIQPRILLTEGSANRVTATRTDLWEGFAIRTQDSVHARKA